MSPYYVHLLLPLYPNPPPCRGDTSCLYSLTDEYLAHLVHPYVYPRFGHYAFMKLMVPDALTPQPTFVSVVLLSFPFLLCCLCIHTPRSDFSPVAYAQWLWLNLCTTMLPFSTLNPCTFIFPLWFLCPSVWIALLSVLARC